MGTYREQGTVDRKLMLSLNALNRECFWDIEIGGGFHHGDTETQREQAKQDRAIHPAASPNDSLFTSPSFPPMCLRVSVVNSPL